MAVLKNTCILGRDVIGDLCEVLNIKQDNERIVELRIKARFDDVVEVEKVLIPTRRGDIDD